MYFIRLVGVNEYAATFAVADALAEADSGTHPTATLRKWSIELCCRICEPEYTLEGDTVEYAGGRKRGALRRRLVFHVTLWPFHNARSIDEGKGVYHNTETYLKLTTVLSKKYLWLAHPLNGARLPRYEANRWAAVRDLLPAEIILADIQKSLETSAGAEMVTLELEAVKPTVVGQ